MSADAEAEVLRAMPKVDSHCHLDGSLRPETVLDLAKRLNIRLPADNAADLRRFVTVSPDCRSLEEFLEVFERLYPLLRDPASLERIAYELTADCAAENIRHLEVRFAPALQAHDKFPIPQVVEATLRGLRRGLKDHAVTSGVILCLYRGLGRKENRATLEGLKSFYDPANGLAEPGVVGMDLAGDEASHPIAEYADLFQEARRLGIPSTCHAGETGGAENVRGALELGVRRIGHGVGVHGDEPLLREIVRRRIPLEISITSNLRTKSVRDLASHPLRRFYEAGAPVTLNTDDPGVIGIRLTDEYRTARGMGFSIDELARVAIEAVDHLFLPAGDRKTLKAAFDREMKAVFNGRRVGP
ncbi:MAG: adenosine deaminase [Elusimicrobiota bacterium]